MKYKVIGASVCLAAILLAALIPLFVTEENRRYHQHLEQSGYTPCTDHGEEQLCTHLPLVIIDTKGEIIPGRVLVPSPDPQEVVYETTPDGSLEITAHITTVAWDGVNHHVEDTPDLESDMIIHARGNSSRTFDKLSYAVDLIDDSGLDNNLPFLGMDAHSEWALHGPFLDRALIRNYMWYNIAGEIMDYAPNVRFCEVIINGEYQGLYLAVEKITAGNGTGRLNLKTTEKNQTVASYVIEYDKVNEVAAKNMENFTHYTRFLDNRATIAYPKGKYLTQELADAIEADFSKFEKSLYSYDYDDDLLGYSSYIDQTSFVDYFLINELTCNYDAGNRSTFIYRELNEKYKMCVWDFDACCCNYVAATSDETFYLPDRPWFARLVMEEEFTKQVVQRYRQLRETWFSEEYLNGYIDDTVSYLGEAIDRNWEVWGYCFEEEHNILIPAARNLHSYDEAIDQMKSFLSKRIGWLDANIETLRQFSAESAVKHYNEITK